MKIQALIDGTPAPGTQASLAAQLRALGVCRGDLLLVHSSLSALGWVSGGAVAVLEALFDVLGPDGTLVMPTHCPDGGDPARWTRPPVPPEWVEHIRAHRPAFDPARTPTRSMGAIPELFRTWPGVRRSSHPVGSFAVRGLLSEAVIEAHDLSEMLGDRSPLGALYRLDAKVLLLGVGHDSNTSLHLGEFRADWAGKTTIREGSRIVVDGESRWVTYEMLDWDEGDFLALGAAYEETHPHTVGSVGVGTARLFSQRRLVDFATDWISTHRSRPPS